MMCLTSVQETKYVRNDIKSDTSASFQISFTEGEWLDNSDEVSEICI